MHLYKSQCGSLVRENPEEVAECPLQLNAGIDAGEGMEEGVEGEGETVALETVNSTDEGRRRTRTNFTK